MSVRGSVAGMAVAGVQGRGVLIDLRHHLGDERVSVGYDLLQQIMAKESHDALAAREVGGDSWNSWDETFRSRTIGVDDLKGTDRQ